MLLTYRGRKTGREYTIPVQYVRTEDGIYVVPGMPELKTWWRNLRGSAHVRLLLRGMAITARAEVMTGDAGSAVIRALEAYFTRFPSSAKLHRVRRDADGILREKDLTAAAAGMLLVRLTPADGQAGAPRHS